MRVYACGKKKRWLLNCMISGSFSQLRYVSEMSPLANGRRTVSLPLRTSEDSFPMIY